MKRVVRQLSYISLLRIFIRTVLGQAVFERTALPVLGAVVLLLGLVKTSTTQKSALPSGAADKQALCRGSMSRGSAGDPDIDHS